MAKTSTGRGRSRVRSFATAAVFTVTCVAAPAAAFATPDEPGVASDGVDETAPANEFDSDPGAPPQPETIAPLSDDPLPPLESELEREPLLAPPPNADGPVDDTSRLDPRNWKHSGFVFEPRIGAAGCFGSHCSGASGHDAAPGVLVAGFLGGNLAGLLDVGVEGSWTRLGVGGLGGRNVFELYGIDPVVFEDVVNAELRSLGGAAPVAAPDGAEPAVNLSQLRITGEASMTAASAGPSMRLHVLRRGRGSVYVGTGAHWQMWANRYETEVGVVNLDFHGFSIPAAGGVGFYPIKNVMVGAEFRYVYTNFFAARVDHPDLNTAAPLSAIDDAAAEAGGNVSGNLPAFWNASATVRVRF